MIVEKLAMTNRALIGLLVLSVLRDAVGVPVQIKVSEKCISTSHPNVFLQIYLMSN